MNISRGCFLGLLAFLPLTCAHELAPSHGLRRRAQEGILDVGIGGVHGICDPLASEECFSNDVHVKEELAARLGANSQITAVGNIELGELLCDSLDKVPESTLLRFAIGSNQTVIAERAYFKVMEGDPLTDNTDRKVWIGDVIDPAPPAGSTASTISLTWTEPCDVEGFFLKMITRLKDGTTAALTSVPCAAGTSQEICMVETKAAFKGKRDQITRKAKSGTSRRLLKERGNDSATPSIRKLQAKTQIDVLMLYSLEAMEHLMATSPSAMETMIGYYMAEVNLGNANSEIPLEYRVVHVTELPYAQEASSDNTLERLGHDAAVSLLRNEFGADLVHLIWFGQDTCGLANFFYDESSAYGLTSSGCLDNLTLGHELGHNLGCDHNRGAAQSTNEDHPSYAYGKRYCTGTDPYITLMSYDDDCDVESVNYYSNPDVIHLGKPTGTETENCARRIKETMNTVAANRQTGGGGCASTGDACTSNSDCCDSTCVEGVCGECIYGQFRGNGECNTGLNTLECGWDDGDCCECSNRATFITPAIRRTFNCLEPDPQCLYSCPDVRRKDYINDNFCHAEFNNAECRWDGGDCCQSSCEADFSEDCNPAGGEYNCLQDVVDTTPLTPAPTSRIPPAPTSSPTRSILPPTKEPAVIVVTPQPTPSPSAPEADASDNNDDNNDDTNDPVEAGTKTTVRVSASAYETRLAGDSDDASCGENGCLPALARDGISDDDDSRWSCAMIIVPDGGRCKIKFTFDSPQDIVDVQVAFWEAEERPRTLKVKINGDKIGEFNSSPASTFSLLGVEEEEVYSVTLEAIGIDADEWIDLLEVRFMVNP